MKHCLKKTVRHSRASQVVCVACLQIEHVTSRIQFGKRICEFGDVQEKVADMIQRIYATESLVYLLASNMDRDVMDYQLEAAIGKVMASENAWHVCDDAIQLHGGYGFMKVGGVTLLRFTRHMCRLSFVQ